MYHYLQYEHMKDKTIIFFFSFAAFCFLGQKIEAQVADPTVVVSKFASYMSKWSKTGNDEFMFKINDELFPTKTRNCGIEKALINDGLSMIFVDKDEHEWRELKKNSSIEVLTYLIFLSKAFEDGMKYKYKKPVWLKEYRAPVASECEEGVPVQCVSMDFSTTGSVKYSGTSLFFVQGKYIVNILEFNDPQAKAIRKLSKKHK